MKTLQQFINEAIQIKIDFKGLSSEIKAVVKSAKQWQKTNKGSSNSNKSRYLESDQNKIDAAIEKLLSKIEKIHPEFQYPRAAEDNLKRVHLGSTPSDKSIKNIIQIAANTNEKETKVVGFKVDDYVTHKGKHVGAIVKANSNGTYDIEMLDGASKGSVIKKVKSSDLAVY